MITLDQNQAESPPDLPKGQIAVAVFRRRKRAEDYALVVLAMQLPYWLYPIGKHYYLCVEEAEVEAVLAQLKRYHREHRGWPRRQSTILDPEDAHPLSLLIYSLILIGVFYLSAQMPELENRGMMNTLAIKQNYEWWRLFTALTLHGDLGHLAGNLLSGICFGLFVNRTFGYGLGWMLIILSGALGNLVSVGIPGEHLAIGASTALFGALGILVGYAVIFTMNPLGHSAWKRSLIPIVSGVLILGLTGLTGERVDSLGHLAGFTAGTLLGLVASCTLLFYPMPSKRTQALLGAACLITLLSAWLFAAA